MVAVVTLRRKLSSKDRTWQQRNKLSALYAPTKRNHQHDGAASRLQTLRLNSQQTTRTIISWFIIYSCQINGTQAESVRCAASAVATNANAFVGCSWLQDFTNLLHKFIRIFENFSLKRAAITPLLLWRERTRKLRNNTIQKKNTKPSLNTSLTINHHWFM